MRRRIRFVVERLYLGLLSLYPHRFRSTFGEEIKDIFLSIVGEVEEAGYFEQLPMYARELRSLAVSILREHWHEWKSRKEAEMAPERDFKNGEVSLAIVGSPDLGWIFRWTLLMTMALIAGWLVTAPFTAFLLFVANLGTNLGLWTGISGDTLMPVGFFMGLALTCSAAQWLMLRSYLPRVKSWFLATGAGFLIAGMLILGAVSIFDSLIENPSWAVIVYFLLIGWVVGVAQWIVLRKILQNAFWILLIDLLAAGSFLLSGESITSLIEFFVLLLLPGLITGIGVWIVLKHAQGVIESKEYEPKPTSSFRSKKLLWVGLGLVGLVPIFFLCIWMYATSQIEIAKSRGIYATAEEAVIARNSQGWGGAEVVKVTSVHAGPNRGDGAQPHVWFGGCRVYLDRVPAGWDRDQYQSGSFYLHVREGWVHVPEGAFPEFIGWVMELYDLEGVNEWKMKEQ